jgi:hypothetical protein
VSAAAAVFVAVFGGACKDDGAAASASQRAAPAPKLAGIYPERWTCETVAPLAALGELLGGKVVQLDSASEVPHGVPHPCNYEVTTSEAEYWTFDLDCRDGMKPRADALFAQYRASSAEAIARYGQLEARAARPGDAGVAHPPEPAVEVAVGAKGLDHHGQGLIFIDDDAPCYVRVTGKDAARRLALAQLIARNLTLDNAPMTPRLR